MGLARHSNTLHGAQRPRGRAKLRGVGADGLIAASENGRAFTSVRWGGGTRKQESSQAHVPASPVGARTHAHTHPHTDPTGTEEGARAPGGNGLTCKMPFTTEVLGVAGQPRLPAQHGDLHPHQGHRAGHWRKPVQAAVNARRPLGGDSAGEGALGRAREAACPVEPGSPGPSPGLLLPGGPRSADHSVRSIDATAS